jgi:hypothetical protein
VQIWRSPSNHGHSPWRSISPRWPRCHGRGSPHFPGCHEHAQWSDVFFAAAALAWAWDCVRSRRWPRLRAWHVFLALYLGTAVVSDLAAPPAEKAGWKLLGLAELCALAFVTEDMAERPGVARPIAWVTAATTLAVAAAALAGLTLFYAGVHTRLVGTYGDLVPSTLYARVQAGLYHPNLLASYCIFAAAVIARRDARLPLWLARLTGAALWLTVTFTFSRAFLGFTAAAAIRAAHTRRQCLAAAAYVAACAAMLVLLTVATLTLDPSRVWTADLNTTEPAPRWQTMTSSLRTLSDSPLLGCGSGVPPGLDQGHPVNAHLTLLGIAATLGLPALAAFVGIVLSLWRGRGHPLDTATWSGLVGLGLDSLASDIQNFRHLWVLFGLAAAPPEQTNIVGTARPSGQIDSGAYQG